MGVTISPCKVVKRHVAEKNYTGFVATATFSNNTNTSQTVNYRVLLGEHDALGHYDGTATVSPGTHPVPLDDGSDDVQWSGPQENILEGPVPCRVFLTG